MIRLQAKLETLVSQLELFANKLNRAHHDIGFLQAQLAEKDKQLELQSEYRARAAVAIMSDVERHHMKERIDDLEQQLDRVLAQRHAQQMPPLPLRDAAAQILASLQSSSPSAQPLPLSIAARAAARRPPAELVLCHDLHRHLAAKHRHDRHIPSSLLHRYVPSAPARRLGQPTGNPVTTAPGENVPVVTHVKPLPTLARGGQVSDDYLQRALAHNAERDPFDFPLLPINYLLFLIYTALVLVMVII